ncbi:hypothetical protein METBISCDRAFT_24881, partial [Metschnikowia bicuspidata]
GGQLVGYKNQKISPEKEHYVNDRKERQRRGRAGARGGRGEKGQGTNAGLQRGWVTEERRAGRGAERGNAGMEGRGSESGVCVPGWAVERGREEGVVEDSSRRGTWRDPRSVLERWNSLNGIADLQLFRLASSVAVATGAGPIPETNSVWKQHHQKIGKVI